MMQWSDNSARYGSPPSSSVNNNTSPNSTTNSTGSTYANNAVSSATTLQSSATATQQLQNSLSMLPQTCNFYGVHPVHWGREEVKQWLKLCISEFSFTDVQVEKFAMNGKALILLKKEDFIERSPSAGDVLYNILQKLLEAQNKSSALAPFASGADMAGQAALMNLMMVANNPFFAAHGLMSGGFPGVAFPAGLSRSSLPLTPPSTSSPQLGDRDCASPSAVMASQQNHSRSNNVGRSISHSPQDIKPTMRFSSEPAFQTQIRKSEGDMHLPTSLLPRSVTDSVIKAAPPSHHPYNLYRPKDEPMEMTPSPGSRGKSDCRLLWEFISKLLKDSSYIDYIKWENASDYTFRIVNPAQLSKLWGIQKNRTNMTYEKLSRALRYYYRMDIIEKVPGRRLTYRFMRPPHEIKRGQRGAKPGVPRKSRSTDEETECIDEIDPTEGEALDHDSELSADEDRLPSTEYNSLGKQTENMQQPIDLVSHQRHSVMSSGSAVYPGGTYTTPPPSSSATDLTPKSEPHLANNNAMLCHTLSVGQLSRDVKPKLNDWNAGVINDRPSKMD